MFRPAIIRHHTRLLAVVAGALAMTAVAASEVRAHCDTMDGPVVAAAMLSLETGALAPTLIWVRAEDEADIRRAFEHVLSVRKLDGAARELADRYFLETVVRIHREGEGEPYTGLKPAGTDHGPAVPATDAALESGSLDALESLLVSDLRRELHERFHRASEARGFAPGDLEAGRAYVAAYVELMHFVEHVHALLGGVDHTSGLHVHQ